jgi:hypothetical protein
LRRMQGSVSSGAHQYMQLRGSAHVRSGSS